MEFEQKVAFTDKLSYSNKKYNIKRAKLLAYDLNNLFFPVNKLQYKNKFKLVY